MKYQWKNGAQVKTKADVAHKFLEKIREGNNGVLDLELAVQKSKPKNAPLHKELEWDDEKCGDKYRREQMRYIVRSIEAIRPEMPNTPVREYEAVEIELAPEPNKEPTTSMVFMRTEDILSNPVARDTLLMRAVNDAIRFRKRYAALSELSKLIDTIDEVVQSLA